MADKKHIRLGTRGSELALWQAHWARDVLRQHDGALEVEIVEVQTTGDQDVTTPLAAIGEVGLFTHTLEQHLLSDRIDLAVHSLKDVPAQLAEGCELTGFSPREDARDAWFHRDGVPLEAMSSDTVVATGSLRRRSQLLWRKPNLQVVGLRGNLNTRWRKFEEGQFDAMILAAAGVRRLGWQDRASTWLEPDQMLPAVGQGIVGLETRAGSRWADTLAAVSNPSARRCALAERSLLAAVAGGCVVPLAGYCIDEGGELWLRARLGQPDGSEMLEAQGRAGLEEGVELGQRVAQDLLDLGGGAIIEAAKSAP